MPGIRKLTDQQAQDVGRRLVQGESQQALADEYEVSRSATGQIAQGKSYKKGNKGIQAKLHRNRRMKQADLLRRKPPPLPDGVFRVVVIDPPWPMVKILTRHRPKQFDFDYPTMEIPDIAGLRVPDMLADDAFVFLWTPAIY